MVGNSWYTPECAMKGNSECQIVGNKANRFLEEDSNYSRRVEFRKLAGQNSSTAECSNLLSRMELENSYGDDEVLNEEDMMTLEEADLMPKVSEDIDVDQVKNVTKIQKRKQGWRQFRGSQGKEDIMRMGELSWKKLKI